MSNARDWRWELRHSEILILIWDDAPEAAAAQRARLAYGMALHKPLRLLLLPGRRVPEDCCVGYADLESARITTADEAAAQIQRWVAALRTRAPEEEPHD